MYIFDKNILRISRDKSRTTPTKIRREVVPNPLKLETGKIASIILGKVARIAKCCKICTMLQDKTRGKQTNM